MEFPWRTRDTGEADQDRHDSDHNRYDVPHESPNSPKCGQPLAVDFRTADRS